MPGRKRLIAAMAACGAGALLLAAGMATRVDHEPPAKPTLSASGNRIFYPSRSAHTIALPGGQSMPIRSVLNIRKSMRYGDFAWNETNVPAGTTWLLVDLRRQMLTAFRSGHEIGSAVILYGAQSKPTPTGSFHVLQKSENYVSQSYDAPMPFMLRLTEDGVAIHASNVRRRAATHGCIGVPREFAQHLFGTVRLGDLVVVMGPDRGSAAPANIAAANVNRPVTKLANQGT